MKLVAIFGQNCDHFLRHFGRQSDLGNHGFDLIGKSLFMNKRLRTFHSSLSAMVIMMSFLSLGRYCTDASGTHCAETKKWKFQFVIFVRLPVSSKHLLNLIEDLFGNQRLMVSLMPFSSVFHKTVIE